MRRAAPRGCEGDEPRDPHTIGGPIRPGSASALKVNTPGNLLSVFALQAAAPVGLPVEIPLEGETTRGSAAIGGGGDNANARARGSRGRSRAANDKHFRPRGGARRAGRGFRGARAGRRGIQAGWRSSGCLVLLVSRPSGISRGRRFHQSPRPAKRRNRRRRDTRSTSRAATSSRPRPSRTSRTTRRSYRGRRPPPAGPPRHPPHAASTFSGARALGCPLLDLRAGGRHRLSRATGGGGRRRCARGGMSGRPHLGSGEGGSRGSIAKRICRV